ncbi:MAG: protein translocase subunit SecD, partial [Rubricoccaceae bacterium]|nr:protein translocase subunit SecD [Rubricoccaceae bacterium]
MQGNGFKIFAVIALVLISGFYLFPTLRAWSTQRNLDAMPADERVQYEDENEASLREIREKALKLGLDLQGGMHVTLEVGVDALLVELAGDRRDDVFDNAVRAAREQAETSRSSFVDLFVDAVEAEQPGTRLSRYFRDADADITARSDNDQIRGYLNSEAEDALNRAVEIIRKRVDRYGVSEPAIAKQGDSRISVELPGVDDPERVRDLLRGTAKLEFRLMADPSELVASAASIVQYYAERETEDAVDSLAADTTTAANDTTGAATDTAETTTDLNELFASEEETANAGGTRFTEIFQMLGDDSVPIFGTVAATDTMELRQYLEAPEVQAMLPSGIELVLSANPDATREGEDEERHFILGV